MLSPQMLRRYPYFAGIKEEMLKKIASISQVKHFEAGEKLFREGNNANGFMILMEGEIYIVYQLGSGQEVIADTLVAGDPIAWSALLEPHTLTASGVASKDGSFIFIEAEGLRRLCEEDKNFGYVMMKEVARTLRNRLSAMRVQVAAKFEQQASS